MSRNACSTNVLPYSRFDDLLTGERPLVRKRGVSYWHQA
jgi:hypothetical protein